MSRLPPKAATAFHYLVIPVSLSSPPLGQCRVIFLLGATSLEDFQTS